MTDVPSREKVLRGLFWKLMFRGRAAHDAASHKRRRQKNLGLTLAVYGVFGLFPALAAFWCQPLAFASSLHMITLLFASLTLAGSVGTMLFVREEAEILLHRPVAAAELLRAKCAVLVTFSLLLALALNAIGLVTSFWNKGNTPFFAIAHVFTTLLLMLFSAALIVLVYNVCLRWFGRERFENLLTLLQTLMAIVMIVGVQIMPRLLDNEALRGIDPKSTLALLAPPVWFGAIDVLLCGAMPVGQVWLPAAIGAGATALTTWLAFVKLGSSYGVGLLAIGESSSPAPERMQQRRLPSLVARAPLRWWLRDPVERQAFLLTSAYLVRDRETKLKLYPSLAPLLVLPVMAVFGPGGRGDEAARVTGMSTFALAYAAIIPIQAMVLLQRSEHWRAADSFRFTPVPHWGPLFHGARKAIVCWLAVPATVVLAGVLAALRGGWTPVLMALPAVLTVVVCSWVPGLFSVWLPLSKPNEAYQVQALGCLVFGGVMFAAMAFGGLAAWMDHLGFFWPFLVVGLGTALLLQQWFARIVAARLWRTAVD
ncbi:MAG TPA: hypothetical protein VFD82_06475 [Planctomycetota bacterium]|nr:hypothetical protein [Planctomycetota bacterium]